MKVKQFLLPVAKNTVKPVLLPTENTVNEISAG